MRIPINPNSDLPLYRQIEQFLRQQIESGSIAAHTKLPPNRKLAEMLEVSRIVVANAYAELESHGLVYSKRGSGTYVSPLEFSTSGHTPGYANAATPPLWQQELFSHSWEPGFLRLNHALSSLPREDSISFSERIQGDEIWPLRDFQKAIQKVFSREGCLALEQSGLAQNRLAGFPPLRRVVAQILSAEGIPVHTEDVMITSGSQQAINLVAGVLLRPGDLVLVENPTYNVAIDLFRSRDIRMISIPMDQQGMVVEQVEEIIEAVNPKLIYTIPTFHNPTGISMNPLRRRRLVSMAQKYNVPIFEDDYIGNLRYEGKMEPALKALDPTGVVIYAGTFTKMLIPGLRLGYMVAHGPVLNRLIAERYVSDLASSELLQRALAEYISVGRYQQQLKKVVSSYRSRRDVLAQSLEKHFSNKWEYNVPKGGGFIWVKLPEHQVANEFLKYALHEGVSFVPGSFFYPGETPRNFLRLNLTINSVERIEEGVKRLKQAYERYLKMVF